MWVSWKSFPPNIYKENNSLSMQYNFSLPISANISKSTPTRVETPLCPGTLKKVSIYFPWGCGGYVGVRILHHEHQLFPTNEQEWYIGNEILIDFPCDYQLSQGWNEFKVEGYNEDQTYEHSPIISFVVIAPTLFGQYPLIAI